jgi:hypothetical protein
MEAFGNFELSDAARGMLLCGAGAHYGVLAVTAGYR